MLVSLSSFDVTDAPVSVEVPPPHRFRPPLGPIVDVQMRSMKYVREPGTTAAQKAGLRFESKVQEVLIRRHSDYYPTPYLHFYDDSGARTIRPDGLLVRGPLAVLVEIKVAHTSNAWWQLRKLYLPVLRAWKFCPPEVRMVEIVRSFDPATPFPEKVRMIGSFEAQLSRVCEDGAFWVLPWPR